MEHRQMCAQPADSGCSERDISADIQLDDLVVEIMSSTDVIAYIGEISHSGCDAISNMAGREAHRENVLLILSTFGGNPDAGYRIARALQRNYKRFSVFVPRICKSAGTLIALGADEIIMSDNGELGPLDTQVRKQDELFEFGSSLDPLAALDFLRSTVLASYREYLTDIKVRGGLGTKIATQIAAELSLGTFKPIYEQIDPQRLGELFRAINIAREYGRRLGTRNLKPHALDHLTMGYASHSFVIDREEAEELFRSVRPSSAVEERLLKLTLTMTEHDAIDDGPIVRLLNVEPPLPQEGRDDAVEHAKPSEPMGQGGNDGVSDLAISGPAATAGDVVSSKGRYGSRGGASAASGSVVGPEPKTE